MEEHNIAAICSVQWRKKKPLCNSSEVGGQEIGNCSRGGHLCSATVPSFQHHVRQWNRVRETRASEDSPFVGLSIILLQALRKLGERRR